MDDIPRSADAKLSLSYSLLSLLLILFLVQSMSLLFIHCSFLSLPGLGETSCFLTDVTYSPKSLFRSVNPAFFRLMLKLSCVYRSVGPASLTSSVASYYNSDTEALLRIGTTGCSFAR